jgi:hypothetical protein
MHEQDDDNPMPTEAEFKSLVKMANAGDAMALVDLRRTLDDNPVIWQRLGDMGAYAQRALIEAIAGGDKLLFESITRAADELRATLQETNPSKLEELAIDRIVACWLEMRWIDAKHSSTSDATLPQARFNLRLKDSAARRYEAAVRSLVLIRKLLPAAAESLKPKLARVG